MLRNSLEEIAVDKRLLATNFTDVIPDCCGADVDPVAEMQDRHPLYNWLIGTELSRRVRGEINDPRTGNCFLQKGENGYIIKVPGTFWSLEPADSSEECCWPPFDFAKCAGEVPVHRLCLKDCDSVDDELLGGFLRVNSNYGGVARSGETYTETKKRIARLSLAFLTQYNVMYGRDEMTTPILKPFHGLFEVMSNPAVVAITGANILSAFDTLACRLALMGDISGYIVAVNPVIYNTILTTIRRSQYGEYPEGWTKNGDEVSFRGMRFVRDSFVPVDLEAGTGEAWILVGDAVGLWMATDLLVADRFIKESGHQEESLANGCGSSCTYYYNYGAAFNNNANRIARIVDIPISAHCAEAAADISGLVNPITLIPRP